MPRRVCVSVVIRGDTTGQAGSLGQAGPLSGCLMDALDMAVSRADSKATWS